jgi:large subunit ribosomal protein L3
MKFILGTKMPMTQIWRGDKVMAVTPVTAGPCAITKIKTKASDGYQALQLAYGSRKDKNISKPVKGQVKDLNLSPRHMREFRTEDNVSDFKAGQVITAAVFAVGDVVDVVGTSKGKGFQGVVKRHGFHGHYHTHGNKDQERHSGSVAPKGPAHVFKGTRMGGRMGGDRVTVKNLEVVAIEPENNLIYIQGALPGAVNGLIMVKGKGELKIAVQPVEAPAPVEAEAAAENAPVEEPAAAAE